MIEIIMDKYKQPELLQRLTSLSQKINKFIGYTMEYDI